MYIEDDIDQATALKMMERKTTTTTWFDNKKPQQQQIKPQKNNIRDMSDAELLELHEDKSIEVELARQFGFNVTKVAAFLMHVKKELIKRKLLSLNDATSDSAMKDQISKLKLHIENQKKALEDRNKKIKDLQNGEFINRLNQRNAREAKIHEEFRKLVKLEVGESTYINLIGTAQKTVEMKND